MLFINNNSQTMLGSNLHDAAPKVTELKGWYDGIENAGIGFTKL